MTIQVSTFRVGPTKNGLHGREGERTMGGRVVIPISLTTILLIVILIILL